MRLAAVSSGGAGARNAPLAGGRRIEGAIQKTFMRFLTE